MSTKNELGIEDEYIGDGVYAGYDGYHIKLYTHDGYGEQAVIYLDTIVLSNFERYYKRVIQKVKERNARSATKAELGGK